MTAPNDLQSRRKVRFESFDDILADIEKLTAGETFHVGDWSFAQNLEHLALTMDTVLTLPPLKFPCYVRIVGWFVRSRSLARGFPTGFKIPSHGKDRLAPPASTTLDDALEHFHRSFAQMKIDLAEGKSASHAVFGHLNADQWKLFHLRHCELHLSHIRPL